MELGFLKKLPDRLLRIPLVTRTFPAWTCYGLTTLFVLVSFALRQFIFSTSSIFVFTFFFPAIIAAGTFFGRGTALYATFISVCLAIFYVLPSDASSRDIGLEIIGIGAFAITGAAISLLTELVHDAYLALSETRARLIADAESRDLLMREIAHRTRNDLSLMTALLSLQAIELDERSAKKALASTAERLQTMARTQALLDVHMQPPIVESRAYITALCDNLRLTIFSEKAVQLAVYTERRELTREIAVTLGLIVNELLTNAIKYGFPGGRAGSIEVWCGAQGNAYELRVKDTGVGFTPSSDSGTGFGLQLARTLARQQGGSLEVVPVAHGAYIKVAFPLP